MPTWQGLIASTLFKYKISVFLHDLAMSSIFNFKIGNMQDLVESILISPDVILCGWLGSKHQLTNLYPFCSSVTVISKTLLAEAGLSRRLLKGKNCVQHRLWGVDCIQPVQI